MASSRECQTYVIYASFTSYHFLQRHFIFSSYARVRHYFSKMPGLLVDIQIYAVN